MSLAWTGGPGSVLVVDDDSAALQTFTLLLGHSGIEEVCGVTNAEEALAMARARRFDVILCDYRMHGMDGVEFLEQLRSCGDRTPVIMVSGAPDKVGVIRAMGQNVDFFVKPVRIGELLAAMNRIANKTMVLAPETGRA